MPTIDSFKTIEMALRDFHNANNQNHLKFIFPPNKKLTSELQTYLLSTNYSIGFLELYSINPREFIAKKNSDIEMKFVTEENIDDFF